MGSCLSGESRSSLPCSPTEFRKRKNLKRKLGSRNSSFDYRKEERLHHIPGMMFLNDSSEIASLFTQQGKKGINQDAMIVWENFGSRKDTVFCGVFDGHGPYGHMVAKRVRDSLPLKLSTHWENDLKSDEILREFSVNSARSLCMEDASLLSMNDPRVSTDIEETGNYADVFPKLKDSFLKAFKVMDRELRMYANIDCFCSGTTAVTVVKQGQDLVIGNVGDSRAILGTRDENNTLVPVQLTVDLKPNLPAEEARIRKCKGRVFALREEPEVARVWLPHSNSPGLAMARAFGDFCLKDFGLISIPEISYRCITDRDEFVVLATDGIWDVLSNEEVVNIVGSCPTQSGAAQELVQSAVKAWRSKYPTSKVDDCAVVCLFLASKKSVTSIVQSEEDDASREAYPPYLTESNQSTTDDIDNTTLGQEDGKADRGEASDTERVDAEFGEAWSALEGVSRVNTLLNMPRFVPGIEDIKAAQEIEARKEHLKKL